MSAVLPTAVGAASIAVMLAAGWFIGGAVARWIGEPSPDIGDRTTGFVFAAAGVFMAVLSLSVAYGIGAAILDALR